MKFTIINIANKMPAWVVDACAEYLKRINHGAYECKIIEIKSDKNPNKSALDNMELEAKKIKAHIPTSSFVVVLDEHGQKLSSTGLADKIRAIELNYSHITFIIGGADGVSDSLKKEANYQLQLSNMTFPHALVRVIILEQIYRAISIMNNHPYHRE